MMQHTESKYDNDEHSVIFQPLALLRKIIFKLLEVAYISNLNLSPEVLKR